MCSQISRFTCCLAPKKVPKICSRFPISGLTNSGEGGEKKRSSPATPAHPRTRDIPVIFSYTLNSWLYISFICIYIYWLICYNCVYISYWGYPYDSGNLFLCTPVIWIQQLAMTMFNHWSWIFNGSDGSYKSTVVVNGNQVIQ